MAMKMSVKEQATEIDQFMNGPLLTWFLTCMEFIGEQASEGLSYGTLIDGVLIHRIFRTMQLPVIDDGVCQPLNQKQRYLNLKKIMENIRHFYEVEQNQALMRVPKIDRLAKEPEQNVREMESLLYLLLGCAVSSPNKKAFINAIELLDYESKRDIAMCIMKVLETSEYILSYEKLTSDENQKGNALWALDCIREMQAELDSYREIDYTHHALAAGAHLHTSTARPEAYKSPESERSQLTDNERALRRQINELRDQLYDNVTEVQDLQAKNQQLKKENEALAADAKLALIYRDQLDELQEKAERVERLEIEMQNYKRKMDEFASMKQRLTVLAEENEALLEKQAESEKLYGTYKSRAESYRAELESRIAELEESKHELDTENRSISCENRELRQENAKLEHKSRNSLSSSRVEQSLMSIDSLYETSALNAGLSDELADSAKTTLQKIIAEGQRLERTMESLQQQQQGSAAAAKDDYEKERQELSNILWLMRQHAESLTGVSCELGSEVLSDLQRLTKANDRLTAENERLRAELDSARATLANHSNHMKSMDGRDWEVQDLKESIIMLRENYCQLYEENKKLKMRLEAEAKSARENEKRLQLEIFAKDRKVVEVGYQLDMMVDRCAGQAQTISSLSLDKKMLVETNGLLQEQSQEFYMRWMAELQQSRIRESKVHSLCRTKERLEDKIMELHKRNDSPRPPAEKPRKKRSLLTLIRRGGSELFGRGRNGGIEPAASLVRDDFEFSRPAISAAGAVASSSAFPSSSSHSPTTSSDSDNEPPSNASSLARNNNINNNNINDNNNNDNDEDNERVIDNLVNNVFPAANFARSDTDTQASDTVGKYFGRRNRPFWSSEETRDDDEEEENAQQVPAVQLERTTDSEAAEDEEAYFIDARRPVGEETETNLGCA